MWTCHAKQNENSGISTLDFIFLRDILPSCWIRSTEGGDGGGIRRNRKKKNNINTNNNNNTIMITTTKVKKRE